MIAIIRLTPNELRISNDFTLLLFYVVWPLRWKLIILIVLLLITNILDTYYPPLHIHHYMAVLMQEVWHIENLGSIAGKNKWVLVICHNSTVNICLPTISINLYATKGDPSALE